MAKRLSAEEKMAIVLEGLRGNKTVAEICREHGISQAQGDLPQKLCNTLS